VVSTPDPAEWIAECDESEDHHLLFKLRHRFENPGAIMALGEKRCTVTDPGGIRTEWTGRAFVVSYHQATFSGAPPVRNGRYRFTWEGRDAKGAWHWIAMGTYGVTGLPALIVTLRDSQWENWKYVALLAALHVEITNTTNRAILIASYAFTTDNRGLPSWESSATGDQHIEVMREINARQEGHRYGPSLRIHSEVPARDSVSGWFVTAVTRDPAGGTPECVFIVKDDIGNEYPVTIERQEPTKAKTFLGDSH
jgi:hypothetical protein